MINLIVSVDENGGIGYKNGIPWPRIQEEIIWYKSVVKTQTVVMGPGTWKTVQGPIKDSTNYVVTQQDISNFPGVFDCYNYKQHSIPDIIDAIDFRHPSNDVVIIGGKDLFDAAYKYCDNLYITRILGKYKCDTYIDIDEYTENYDRLYQRYIAGSRHTPGAYIERWHKKDLKKNE